MVYHQKIKSIPQKINQQINELNELKDQIEKEENIEKKQKLQQKYNELSRVPLKLNPSPTNEDWIDDPVDLII